MVRKVQQQEVRALDSLNLNKVQRKAIIKNIYAFAQKFYNKVHLFESSKRHNEGLTPQGT